MMSDGIDSLVDTIAALPGLEPCRACASYGNPTDPEDDSRHFDVVFTLETSGDAPTVGAWRSLAFLAEAIGDMVIGGRHIELTINATGGSLFFSVDGDLDSITPDEVAGWLRDLGRATS
jgi:hypothetical protein